MKKIFTFLVAFLTTVSGAVWGQTYPTAGSGSGTQDDPYILDLSQPKDIGSGAPLVGDDDIVEWHGGGGLGSYNAFQIKKGGDVDKNETVYYRVINSNGPDAVSSYCIEIDNGASTAGLDVTLILDNINILVGETGEPHNGEGAIYIEENQGIFGGGDEHNVTIQLVGENHITYTTEGGGNGSAIWVNGDSNLTINGTGSLYATGYVGIGNHSGISGDITINGGTVVANGMGANGSGFGGTVEDGTNLNINGNTFVISNGSGNVNENFTKGIYYDSSEGDYIADVKDDVVLDSSYPSADEILGSELKFNILDGSTLTLGSGISFPTSRLANQDDEGKLYAYKVSYDLNNNIKLGSTDYTINVNGSAPASIYAGPNVSLATELPTATNTEQTWQAMAWGHENGGSYQEVTTTPTSPSPITVAANNNEFKATTIWAVKKWTTVQVTENGIMDKGFQLFYPQEAASLYSLTNGEALKQYGAKLGTERTEKNQVVPDGSVTATASDTPAEVTLTISGEDKTITIPFKVNKDVPNLKDATLTTKSVEYDGNAVTQQDIVVSVKFPNETNAVGYEMYTVKFAADNEGSVGTELQSAPTNAGTYWVKAVAKVDEVTNLTGETEYVKFDITKATATVTAEDVEWTIGTAGPTFTDKLKATGVEADKNKLTVASFTNPTGTWDKAGVYKVTYTDIKLNDDLAGNYNEVADVEGTLTVKKTGGEGGEEIKPGDPDDDETEIIPGTDTDQDGWEWVADKSRYERTYDGEPHPLSTISLKYKNEEGETAWETLSSDEFSVEYSSTPVKDVVEAGYTATITITGSEYYSGTATMTLYINPRPMVIDINKLTAEDVAGITAATEIPISEADVDFENFNAEKGSGIVAEEEKDAKVSGKITVTPAESTEEGKKAYTIAVDEEDFTLDGVDGGKFAETNYTATYTYNGKSIEEAITETIDDITPGEGTDIGDGDDDGNEWTWNGKEYEVIYDGNEHGIASITVSDAEATIVTITYSDEEGVKLEGEEKPLNAGHYTAEVVVKVGETSKSGEIPLWIKERPLRVDFDLTNLSEADKGQTLDAADFANYDKNGENEGLVDGEEPFVDGTFKIADTPNDEGKYEIVYKDFLLKDSETFSTSNYDIKRYINGKLISASDGTISGDDGADINEDYSGGTINTRQYRLYLANKDYNVVDAKADYAAEGLELFSRHDKKYTKVGGSFTVWYEKDGVANAGGYRIFWSNRANGEYKEVKFDTVSEYFQIRNVQSDVYVKIYAADGFPVGNEEISAADYRAYAQPNKIVVITPQPTDVQIISMAGAVVATDKVTGQREFANLTEGVYIVRMGETVVKLQVRK